MENLDDFEKDSTVRINQGVEGVSTWGKRIKFTGNINGTVKGTEQGRVLVDVGSLYHLLISYDPEDLKIIKDIRKGRAHTVKTIEY